MCEGHTQRTNTLCQTLKTSYQQGLWRQAQFPFELVNFLLVAILCFRFLRWGALFFPSFCPHTCRAGGTTLSMCEFMQRELDFTPFGLRSTSSGVESQFEPRQEPFRLNAANATPIRKRPLSVNEACTQSLESVPIPFCPLVKGECSKTTRRSTTLCALSLTAHDVGRIRDCSGGCHHACSHLSAYMGGRCSPKKQGERHLDHARCKIRTLTWQAGRAVAHKLRASSHAFPCRQNFDSTGAVVCDSASMGAVIDQKANVTLTELNLDDNAVGEAGAAALADALQATVLTCGHMSFQECASCCHRCRFAMCCEQLASLSCCAVCVAASVFFLFLGGNVGWRGELFASCSQVDVARFQNRIGLIESLATRTCFVAERRHIIVDQFAT